MNVNITYKPPAGAGGGGGGGTEEEDQVDSGGQVVEVDGKSHDYSNTSLKATWVHVESTSNGLH